MTHDQSPVHFVLVDRHTGAVVAGPFRRASDVPPDLFRADVDWRITSWVDPKFGKLV